jgi:hypothetical protein
MSTPILRIKVLPKPIIKGKMDVRFPARVFGEAFIKVKKENGNFTIYPDASDLDPGPVASPATARALLYDDAVGIWRAVSIESLLVSGLDPDLQAIAALSGTGILARTADNAWALRQLVQPSAGLTIADPDAMGGNPTFALANDLAALEALTGTNTIYYRSGVDTWSPITIGSLLSWSGGTINVGDPELVALAGLVSAADRLPYFTGSGTAALATFTAFARTLVDDADAPSMRATLGSTIVGDAVFIAANAAAARSAIGAVIGANVQAWDADLDALAALSGTGIARRTGANTWSVGTAVANSELAAMANGTVKGNVSGSSAIPSDLTVSQVLDAVGSTRGSILYRGASGWAIAAPTTSGQVWTSNGPGSDPSYQDVAGGGGGLSDTDRRNILLDRIYQSKLFGTPRRVINSWATGFKAATDADRGINTGASSNVDTSNAASAGYVAPSAGSASSATPGTTAALQNFTVFDRSFNLTNGKVVKKIGLYNTLGGKTLTVKIGKRNGAGNYDIVVSQSVSHTGTGWEYFTLSSPYTVPGSGTYQVGGYTGSPANPNVIASVARSYASTDIGVSSGVTFTEDTGQGIGVRAIYDTENMTLVTLSQTSDANVSNARVLLEFDNSAAPTLNTDLTAEVTCDGGANWASATLSAVTANSQGGRTVAETADTACTSGTSFAARIKTLTGKMVSVYGASVAAH